MNIEIYFEPVKEFRKRFNEEGISLTKVIYDLDNKNNIQNYLGKDLIIESSEFFSLNNHVIENFSNFLNRISPKKVYINNPPKKIMNSLSEDKEIKYFKYPKITEKSLKEINSEFKKNILGQENVRIEILSVLYQLIIDNKKPKVMLFYGPPGVGKTETAKLISNLLGGKLLRKQLSLYRANDFTDYLFGGKHGKSCFSKDLLDRESNIVLLDEFDKCDSTFYGAFYQMFDEGIFEDENYKVKLDGTIIICTSNYRSEDEVRKHIGDALYSRFDGIIEFCSLNLESKKEIVSNEYEKIFKKLRSNEQEIVLNTCPDLKNRLENAVYLAENVRDIRKLINKCISLILVNNLVESS